MFNLIFFVTCPVLKNGLIISGWPHLYFNSDPAASPSLLLRGQASMPTPGLWDVRDLPQGLMHTKQSACQLSYNTVLLRLFSFHSSMQCVSVEERRTIALFQLNSTQLHFHPGVKAYVYPVYYISQVQRGP